MAALRVLISSFRAAAAEGTKLCRIQRKFVCLSHSMAEAFSWLIQTYQNVSDFQWLGQSFQRLVQSP